MSLNSRVLRVGIGGPVGSGKTALLQALCQRLLYQLASTIGEAAREGLARDDAAIGGTAPGVAIASALHETQYSRLFRS